jgi:hypothetical protein
MSPLQAMRKVGSGLFFINNTVDNATGTHSIDRVHSLHNTGWEIVSGQFVNDTDIEPRSRDANDVPPSQQ